MSTRTGELSGGKPMVKSKTFWGIVLSMVPLLDLAAGAAGYPGAISTTISIVTGAVGQIVAIFGNAKREQKITSIV